MAVFGWRWARGRGAKQASLFLCGMSAVVIAFLGKAEASIFDSARAKLSDWTEPALGQVRTPFIAVERWFESVGSVFTLYRENMQLKQENAELRKWQNVALSLESKMRRYEVLLNAVPEPKLPSVTARVIGEVSRPFAKTMILNAGTTQQVKKGQAVMDDRGLLGRIYVSGERTSWVILLTDLNSRVPVMVESSHRRAILTGDNTPAPKLELDVGDAPVKAGDRVLSTGDGGLLPPDIPVGVVMQEGTELRVSLFARPGTTDFVNVMSYGIPEPPPAADPVPATNGVVVAGAKETVSPTAIADGLTPRATPPGSTVPLQSQNPAEPRFDGQNEEQDR